MQAEGVSAAGDSPSWRPSRLRAFAQSCAELLTGVDYVGFASRIAALLSTVATIRSVVITSYELGAPPRTLFHTISDDAVASTITLYEKGPFKLDPFFLACVIDRRAGVFRLADVAPDNFTRTAYYLDFYRRLRMGEEVGMILPLRDGSGIVISLESGAAGNRFTDDEIEWLQAVYPLVAAGVSRQWNGKMLEGAGGDCPSMASLFSGFGQGVLSNRECEVVRLILQGHSSASIAAQLGIAPGTVKMHRKHAYQKLAVSSQAQLFQRFMATIAGS